MFTTKGVLLASKRSAITLFFSYGRRPNMGILPPTLLALLNTGEVTGTTEILYQGSEASKDSKEQQTRNLHEVGAGQEWRRGIEDRDKCDSWGLWGYRTELRIHGIEVSYGRGSRKWMGEYGIVKSGLASFNALIRDHPASGCLLWLGN